MAILNNPISIQNKVFETLKKKQYQNFAFNNAQTRLVFAKKELLSDYDDEQVNKEIIGGKDSENITDSINQGDSKTAGNLFSLIGFKDGDTPVQDLRKFIEDNIIIENKPKFDTKGDRFNYRFPVNYPNLTEIDEFTNIKNYNPDYPNSNGWTSLCRRGISGLGEYIYHKYFSGDYSRSTTGLEMSGVKTGKSFSPITNYLSDILNKFKNKFK